MSDIQIIRKDGIRGPRPEGIMDRGGYLLFFPKVQHYVGQDERYVQECDEQDRMAEMLLAALRWSEALRAVAQPPEAQGQLQGRE